jgi:hypothetical protein
MEKLQNIELTIGDETEDGVFGNRKRLYRTI